MTKSDVHHPVDPFIRLNRLPSEWCPGCGIGIVVNTFLQAMKKIGVVTEKVSLVSSGIGCTGKVATYLKLDAAEAETGKVFALSTEKKAAFPEKKIVLFLNDNDFIACGVDAFLNSCRKNEDLLVIYINSFIYHVIFEHKKIRPIRFKRHIAPSEHETPYNMPHLAKKYGANYVARWTPLHCRRLTHSIQEAVQTEGFAFIEVISPCLMYLASAGNLGNRIDRMGTFLKNSVISKNEDTKNLDIKSLDDIVLGVFVSH
jgi:2-oxoglutarate ferredoxin oxidoreductase subunit beta